MSTLAVTNTLVSVFVPIGIAGAVIAVACALIAAFAIARGAAGLAGGAMGVWIVGAMLSISASFATLWTPFLVAVITLGAALVAGILLRTVGAPLRARRRAAEREAAAPAKAPATASVGQPSTRTDAIAIA